MQYLGVTHDTSIFTRVLPAAERWHADVVSALRRLHGAVNASLLSETAIVRGACCFGS